QQFRRQDRPRSHAPFRKLFVVCGVTLLCALFIIIIIIVVVIIAARPKCPQGAFSHAAVAADSRTCSEIGREALRAGGSAVDGAIAALLCTSVVNPQSMGLGGGVIFTVMSSSGQVRVINSRETAPRNFQADLLDSLTGSLQWIGVPGEIRGYAEAHRLYGKLPWPDLFWPTIQLAREGLAISEVLGRYLSYLNVSRDITLFSDDGGNLLKTGDILKFEKLADTLEVIANEGPDVFYTGQIAEDLIRDVQEAGGTLTAQDLAAYRATVTDAWRVPLGEYQMYTPPPPTGGILLSLVMNVMNGYHLNSSALEGEQKTLTYHHYVEAFKFANGLKKYTRDPKFSSEEVAGNATQESFADHIRSLIKNNMTHDTEYYSITPYLDNIGTTHVSVLAEDGSAVSVTSTINQIFGSLVFSPRTGVILNNQLSDFCGRVENISPGERPPSFVAPSLIKSQLSTLVIGSAGGSTITTGLASALMNHLWFGKSLEEAIAEPVVFVDSSAKLTFERKFDQKVIDGLTALGHQQGKVRLFNVVNAVEKVGDCIWAVSDARKLGQAAGY
uniref:Glutathione hydrolase n=1 Tax=Mola mola TaxID=94237 RepID=A0A3Q3WAG9_MOLML